MKVSALADELGLEPAVLLRMCRDRGIRASWEESDLSDDAVNTLREAIRPDDPEHPEEAAPHVANPAVVASFDHLPPTASSAGAGGEPLATHGDEVENEAAPTATPGDPAVPVPVDPAGGPRSEAADQAAAPAFGTIDPRFASVAPVPAEEPPETVEIRAPYTPEVSSGLKSLVPALVLGAAWAFARLLPHWNRGRWWLVPVVCAVFGGALALRSLVTGVEGVAEVTRHPRARRGRTASAVIAGVAALLLLGGTLLGFYDWTAIRIPDAYTRLKNAITNTQNSNSAKLGQLQGSALSATIDPDGADYLGVAKGNCLDIVLQESIQDGITDCSQIHRYEVTGFVTYTGSTYPGRSNLAAEAKVLCTPVFTAYVGAPPSKTTPTVTLLGTYPSAAQWATGARGGMCVAVTGADFSDSVKNTH